MYDRLTLFYYNIKIMNMIAQGRNCQNTTQTDNPNPMLYSLKSMNKNKNKKIEFKLDFSQVCELVPGQKGATQQILAPVSLLPEFLYQGSVGTKGFCSSGQKTTFKRENSGSFQRLIDENILENDGQMCIMRPKPRSNYCQVCHESFQDYLQHIEHASHKKRVQQQTKSTKMIQDLVSSFECQTKRARSEKLIRLSDIDDDDFDTGNRLSTSSKIRVIQSYKTLTPIRIPQGKHEGSQCTVQSSLSPKKLCVQNPIHLDDNFVSSP